MPSHLAQVASIPTLVISHSNGRSTRLEGAQVVFGVRRGAAGELLVVTAGELLVVTAGELLVVTAGASSSTATELDWLRRIRMPWGGWTRLRKAGTVAWSHGPGASPG